MSSPRESGTLPPMTMSQVSRRDRASSSFGLAKYQNNNAPMVFWLDEIAIDAQRIGCAN